MRPAKPLGFLVVLLFFCALTGSIAAQGKILVLTNDYEPYYGHDLPSFGPLLEIAELAFRDSGYEVQIGFKPWARVLEDGQKGYCDVIAGVWLNTGRESWMALSAPILENDIGLFRRKGDDILFKNWADIAKRGILVGTVKGYINPPGIAREGVKTEEVPEDMLNIKKLLAGRIRLALMDRHLGEYLARQLGGEDQIEWLTSVETLYLRLGIMKNAQSDWKKILMDFDSSLARLKREGKISSILKKHGLR
jgi:polar amino acid transport system substrate-binding protein